MKVAAIDSSVVFSILKGEPEKERWLEMLIQLKNAGVKLVVCNVVWAEIANLYDKEDELVRDLDDLGIAFDPLHSPASFLAGQIFRQYRRAKGPRQRIIADFMIGAHAVKQAIGILTADHGYLRAHFHGLRIIDPDQAWP